MFFVCLGSINEYYDRYNVNGYRKVKFTRMTIVHMTSVVLKELLQNRYDPTNKAHCKAMIQSKNMLSKYHGKLSKKLFNI